MTTAEAPPTGATIKREIRALVYGEVEPGRGAPSRLGGYKTGTILMALLNYGLDPARAAQAIGYCRRSVDDVMARAKGAGIIEGKRIRMGGDWFDKKHGGLSFILDCMVVDGLLCYAKGPNAKAKP